MATVLLEARPYRPFKSSEEYLYAMREDLAEWLNTLYPELMINVDNFMDRLDTGVALCKHANNVRKAAEEYVIRKQQRMMQKSMSRSMTTGLAGPILTMGNVHFLPAAKSGTFFARDNVSNFITWCRKCLHIFDCLLFETDDLIMRKNEKHVILCLLEVARRGAKFGMLAPMLVQMERQIDREIAADNKANGVGCGTQTEINGTTTISTGTEEDEMFDSDSDEEDENESPMLVYGPQPQIVTNDLKSLDEMVRDLVEKCTCPSQFPMVRVSEGKYRIGDTKVLIFVRILRSHVMVRVGGGWDTLSHYLDKHDPCRCKAAHRSSVAARLITRTNQQTNGIELHKAQVIYERSPPPARKLSSGNAPTPNGNTNLAPSNLSPSTRSRSRSPSATSGMVKKLSNIANGNVSENQQTTTEKSYLTASPHLSRRSMSPSPRRLADIRKKQNSIEIATVANSPTNIIENNEVTMVSEAKIELQSTNTNNSHNNGNGNGADAYEKISDNGSEISDEGYRSLGLVNNSNALKRISLHSQASNEDTEINGRLTSPDLTVTTSDDEKTVSTLAENSKEISPVSDTIDAIKEPITKFANSDIYIDEDEITVDIAGSTGLKKTGFSDALLDPLKHKQIAASKIPKSPMLMRRKSIDNSSVSSDMESNNSLSRKIPAYRSVRTKTSTPQKENNNTWNGRSINKPKKRPTLQTDTYQAPNSRSNSLHRNSPARTASNGNKTTRTKPTSSSVNTSPKHQANTAHQSQLAQQLLDAANRAKNDAQILEKVKQILSNYSTKNGNGNNFEDFTTAWVNSNGNLDNPPTNNIVSPKSQSKRSSTISSADSCSGTMKETAVVSPRRADKGVSKIPAPVFRSNTGLY